MSSRRSLIAQSNWSGWLLAKTNMNLAKMRDREYQFSNNHNIVSRFLNTGIIVENIHVRTFKLLGHKKHAFKICWNTETWNPIVSCFIKVLIIQTLQWKWKYSSCIHYTSLHILRIEYMSSQNVIKLVLQHNLLIIQNSQWEIRDIARIFKKVWQNVKWLCAKGVKVLDHKSCPLIKPHS